MKNFTLLLRVTLFFVFALATRTIALADKSHAVIHVDETTRLIDAIAASGFDKQEITDLKLTGDFTIIDVNLMKNLTNNFKLRHLDLSDASYSSSAAFKSV